jgi:hypothetical protein
MGWVVVRWALGGGLRLLGVARSGDRPQRTSGTVGRPGTTWEGAGHNVRNCNVTLCQAGAVAVWLVMVESFAA